MAPMQIALMVLGILGATVVIWIPLARKLKRMPGELQRELDAAGQKAVRGPEGATYRGSSTGFSKVKGLGVAALTPTQLIFRPIMGKRIDVPLDQVIGVREDKWFLRSYAGGRMHLILTLKSGAEVGFFFADHSTWMALVRPAA